MTESRQDPDTPQGDESDPMAYMTSRDPSPYLFESQVDMLGRASTGARDAVRTQRGKRRPFVVVGFALMVLVLFSLILGVLLPLLT